MLKTIEQIKVIASNKDLAVLLDYEGKEWKFQPSEVQYVEFGRTFPFSLAPLPTCQTVRYEVTTIQGQVLWLIVDVELRQVLRVIETQVWRR